jgi:DNA-binding transcriptional ArsR family regulator
MDQLSLVFGALADPTRRAILARLATGEATVNELAEPFAMSLQAVSKHLKVLERAELITRSQTAQWRPAQLHGPALGEAGAFLLSYRQLWEDSFDAMNEHLQTLQNTPTPKKKRQ